MEMAANRRPVRRPLRIGKSSISTARKCHNATDWAGGLAFDVLNPDSLPEDAQSWEKAIRKLRTGMMPPAGKPRPPRAELDAFAGELEVQLDEAAKARLTPGAEYVASPEPH